MKQYTYIDRLGVEQICEIKERSGMGPVIKCGNGVIIDIAPAIPTNRAWWEHIRANWSRSAYAAYTRITAEQQERKSK